MPIIHIITNLPGEKFKGAPKAAALAQLIAEKFPVGLEAKDFNFIVQSDQKIFFKGSAEPVAFIMVSAFDKYFTDDNVKLAFELITAKASTDLGLPAERVVVTLRPIDPTRIAIGGVSLA